MADGGGGAVGVCGDRGSSETEDDRIGLVAQSLGGVHHQAMFEQTFQIAERKSTVPRELLAGFTTFLTMSYILVVQPAVLSTDFAGQPTGLESGAVLLATCLSSAVACLVMGLYAKLPIALAPGMGQNFFFVSVIMALSSQQLSSTPWGAALGIVATAGIAFLLLTLVGVRAMVLEVMSPSMRSAIAVGIGLFIAFIGLKNANVLVIDSGLVSLNAAGLASIDAAVFWIGLLVTSILATRRIPGGILLGMIVASLTAAYWGKLEPTQIFGWPAFEQSSILQFDFRAAFSPVGLSFVAVFLFMDIFDTTGTLVGVSHQAGLMKDGNIPRMKEAMLADSVGTIIGACLGTSTVTSYIESAAGVQQGGRTGLVAVTVGVLFLLAIPFSPLIIGLGGYAPITAPALVFVGSMMFRCVGDINWKDESESIPAFLVIVGIPLFFSIADGIALGLIAWPVMKVAKGRVEDVKWTAWLLAAILVAYFLLIRQKISG